ncbi:hypothetical protein [Planctomicrobium sp. SH664]|uniref:hypothetical protein n=1 Tax=Planctomicrobium sp. SH664 TaxID=3448125 RepID=UPI003F5C30E2
MNRRRTRVGNVSAEYFFDRQAIIDAVGKGEARVLNRAGAITRKIARQSMRRRKRISTPGSPPSARLGYLRDFLYYQWDPQSRSMVIGPAKLAGSRGYVVPELLEFGGTVSFSRNGKRITQRFAARPYMGPASRVVKAKFPSLWSNSVTSR